MKCGAVRVSALVNAVDGILICIGGRVEHPHICIITVSMKKNEWHPLSFMEITESHTIFGLKIIHRKIGH